MRFIALGALAKRVIGQELYDFAAPHNDSINDPRDLNNIGKRSDVGSSGPDKAHSHRELLLAGSGRATSSARVASPQIAAKPEIACTGCRMVRQRRRSVRVFLVGHVRPAIDLARIEARQAEIEVG